MQLHQSLGFVGTPTPGTSQVTQVVTQQAGTATVTLSDMGYNGPLQVEVKTDPSPAVGVNVGAVDQMVTFPEGQSQATLSVPILAGAPNPGEVDVTLTATPVNPPTPITNTGPLVLRILASDASIPPTITTEQGTHQGIVLTFSKPMDPAGASNVNNYAVRSSRITGGPWGPFGLPIFGYHFYHSSESVPLRAAVYDPATNSVTLIPKGRLTYTDPGHRDPGVRVEEVVTARTPVGRPPRSHRRGRQPDQWGLDPRKILGWRRVRESAVDIVIHIPDLIGAAPAVLAGSWHSAGDRRTSIPSAEYIPAAPWQSTRGRPRGRIGAGRICGNSQFLSGTETRIFYLLIRYLSVIVPLSPDESGSCYLIEEAHSRNSGRQDLNPRASSKQGRPARRNHKPHGVFHSASKSLPRG